MDLSAPYAKMAQARLANDTPLFTEIAPSKEESEQGQLW
jgi:hypothetical protein